MLELFLESNPDVRFLRLHWVDLSGIVHVRILPTPSARCVAAGTKTYGVGPWAMRLPLCVSVMDPTMFQCLAELRPDWSSLRACGYTPAHAAVMCEVAIPDTTVVHGQCPRHLLCSLLEEHAEVLEGATVGFEVEFVLLDQNNQIPEALDVGESASTSAGIRGPQLQVLEAVADALERAGIPVHHFHSEFAPQLEMALDPLPPLRAADALIHAREAIKHVAIQHGFRATLAPRPLTPRGPFNSTHMHLSVPACARTPDASAHFLAGVMRHLPGLCALGMPSYESAMRVQGGYDSTGAWAAWGTQNRDVPVRRIRDGHWELRIIDASANPFLFLSGVLFSGVHGMREAEPLTLGDCRFYPDVMTEEERQALGVQLRLPTSLHQFIDALRQDKMLHCMMPEEMFSLYVKIKEQDNTAFKSLTDEERRQKLIQFY